VLGNSVFQKVVLEVNLLVQFISRVVFTVIALFFLFLRPHLVPVPSALSKPDRRLRGTVVSCSHYEHHYANNHYRRVSPTLRRRRLLLPPWAIRTIARGELITLVEAIGFYDGLSFVPSVVRQFFKLDNLFQELDLGQEDYTDTHGHQVRAADF
jgi:hypothetical protein